jgi:hypothetical protein
MLLVVVLLLQLAYDGLLRLHVGLCDVCPRLQLVQLVS